MTPSAALLGLLVLATPALHANDLPDPDGKSADMSKPVQVFILLGQSNMLGAGKVKGGDGLLEHAVKEKAWGQIIRPSWFLPIWALTYSDPPLLLQINPRA